MLRYALLLLVMPLAGRAEKPLKDWVAEFNAIDEQVPGALSGHIPNGEALAFLEKNIPRFDCPDRELVRTYYFRWWTYRKHVRKTPEGHVVTEFLPEVPWARKYNTINCPAGHHFREGRWLHDTQILSDYARFYFGGGGQPRQYSFWAADSVLQFCNVTGEHQLAIDLLDELVANHREWEKARLCEDGLFWQIDDRDGMEVSVGGSGKRPTINSYLYGDAMAIAQIAGLAQRWPLRQEFAAKGIKLGRLINEQLWCETHQFYKTIPYAPEGRRLHHGRTCGPESPRVDVRELHGYTPWYFHLPELHSGREVAWKQLLDKEGFWGKCGPTTAEQRHPGFRLAYEGHECQWNGPSWPYATSITLTAMANVLQDYPEPLPITRADYLKQLQIYSNSHRLKLPDGKTVCWIDENLHPHSGDWMARTMLLKRREEGKGTPIVERGQHYNHSTFCDLVITGLMGLKPRLDDQLHLRPLIPAGEWDWCRLEGIRYHGHLLTIQWDRDGRKYGKGAGLRVFVDGKLLGSSETPGALSLKLP